MWVNIQRITGGHHCANVVWPDLARIKVKSLLSAELIREEGDIRQAIR